MSMTRVSDESERYKYVFHNEDSTYTVFYDSDKDEQLFVTDVGILRGKFNIEPQFNREALNYDYNKVIDQAKSFMVGDPIDATYTTYEETEEETDESEDSLANLFSGNYKSTSVEKERAIICDIEDITFDKSEVTIEFRMTDGEIVPIVGKFNPVGVKDEYKTASGTIECDECGNTLDVSCGGYDSQSEAYCGDCDVKYRLDRTRIDDDETGNRVYYCESCDWHHNRSVPDGEWHAVEPNVWGREEYGVNCYCGNTVKGHELEINESVECECGRTVEVSLSE